MIDRCCVVLMTAPDKAASEKLAQGLVEGRLAACVTRVPGAVSTYRWEGKLKTAEEFLLIAKSKMGLVSELVEFVRRNHPHSVPEVLALPVEAGNGPYLDWIGANTRFTKPKRVPAPRKA